MGRPSKTTLALAIALAIAPPAHSLSLQAGGMGQVLIYPYYTVNRNQQTVVSVVNTTNRVKAMKVRFLEGRNGKPVLDFNLYLSPFDVWTGTLGAGGSTGVATLDTSDRSCTVPRLSSPTLFRATNYISANQDWDQATTPASLVALLGSLERTREGHLEMIEMGQLQTGTRSTQLAEEATHNAAGIPINCQALVNAWTAPAGGWVANFRADIDIPSGGLYGAAAIVDAANGTLVGYQADAIEGFYTNTAEPGFLHRSPLLPEPDLGDADNGAGLIDVRLFAVIEVTQSVPSRQKTRTTDQPYSYDAVSLLYMHDAIYNEFVTDTALGAASEWVVTYPTKSAYVDTGASGVVRRPFTDPFRDNGSACEAMTISYWNREEQVPGSVPGSVDFDPPPPGGSNVPALCTQVNVIAFNQPAVASGGPSAVLGSRLVNGIRTVTVIGALYTTGWTRMAFDNPLVVGPQNFLDNRLNQSTGGRVLAGLPVTGFWAANYTRTTSNAGILANYSGAVRHRTSRGEAIVF
jgi:hypothetical protein